MSPSRRGRWLGPLTFTCRPQRGGRWGRRKGPAVSLSGELRGVVTGLPLGLYDLWKSPELCPVCTQEGTYQPFLTYLAEGRGPDKPLT